MNNRSPTTADILANDESAFKLFVAYTDRILNYLSKAEGAYSGSPEAQSMMLLTVMELWVACDTYATKAYPLLLDYGTGFRPQILESLILPKKEQLLRLACVEDYLESRKSYAFMGPPWELKPLHSPSMYSFALRFYDGDLNLKAFHSDIQNRTVKAIANKEEELREKKASFKKHMAEYDNAKHLDCGLRWWTSEPVCSFDCPKRQALGRAQSIRISVFENPLPENDRLAKAIVFELLIPEIVQRWRDTTLTILSTMLEPRISESSESYNPSSHPLIAEALKKWVKSPERIEETAEEKDQDQNKPKERAFRFRVCSVTPPSSSSHGVLKPINEADKKNTCTLHGYNYDFYDSWTGKTVATLLDLGTLSPQYSYAPQTMAEPMKDWILGTSHTLNEVIANLNLCPNDMSLDEFKVFGNMRADVRLQWHNVLHQLITPTLNFNKLNVLFVVLQATNEVGPKTCSSPLRDAHQILDDKAFGRALLDGLDDALRRVEGNWERDVSWCIFLSLALRLLYMTTCRDVQIRCLEYLADIRHSSIRWSRHLIKRSNASQSVEERQDLGKRALSMALICHGTFDVGSRHLLSILNDDAEAALLVESSMIIAGQVASHQKPATDPILTILLQRWTQLSYEAEPLLRDRIVGNTGAQTCLDMAIYKIWETYTRPDTPWSAEDGQYRHLLVASSCSGPDEKPSKLQYNLLTGIFLVDGNPLSTLPNDFLSHATYKRLFRDQSIRVFPSRLPRMRFLGASQHCGHEVHFGMVGTELIIKTRKENKVYEFIPAGNLEEDFPRLMVSDYSHWLICGENIIEFRPLGNNWGPHYNEPQFRGLFLRFSGDGSAQIVTKPSQLLIDIQSMTFKVLSELFRPLERPEYLHLTVDEPAHSTLNIELPRFQTSFRLARGTTEIYSNHYNGYVLDNNQCIETLVGLESKLVLCSQENFGHLSSRAVIVPQGQLFFTREPTGHSSSWVVTDDEPCVRYHFFQMDPILGQLKDGGALQSKLFLCYLHAHTSHCLPDNLTGRTGTEEAYRILRSAAVRSFDRLCDGDIQLLHQIADISPKRTYHHAASQRIQTVDWSELSGLAQDDSFYLSVKDILDQARRCEIFYPQDGRKIEALEGSTERLIERQSTRSSVYRVSHFMHQQFSTEHDSNYEGRDFLNISDAGRQTHRLTKALDNIQPGWLTTRISANTMRSIVSVLGCKTNESRAELPYYGTWTEKRNSKPAIKLGTAFDVGWLENPSFTLRHSWCDVHQWLFENNMSQGESDEKYKMMMLFAGLSFAESANPEIIQVLLVFATAQAIPFIDAAGHSLNQIFPSQFELNFSDGAIFDRSRLYSLAKIHVSSHEQLWQDLSDTLLNLVQAFEGQWPCETPRVPHEHASICSESFMIEVRLLFRSWFRNKQYLDCLAIVIDRASGFPVIQAHSLDNYTIEMPSMTKVSKNGFIKLDDIFDQPAPVLVALEPQTFEDYLVPIVTQDQIQPEIYELLEILVGICNSNHEYQENYVRDLKRSLEKFEINTKSPTAGFPSTGLRVQKLRNGLNEYLGDCHTAAMAMFSRIRASLSKVPTLSVKETSCFPTWPKVTPILLLEQLSNQRWHKLPASWQDCLIQYAKSLTVLQRAARLRKSANNEKDLLEELKNVGHENWDPKEYPESLLLEVENAILIRPMQENIAKKMRQPPLKQNAVMQLNMGEGKSSVIVPIVAAVLANGSQILRIIVTKPQFKQMLHTLAMKLGGLLNRQVYTLPASRQLRPTKEEGEQIMALCKECGTNGGVLLLQLDHILSFKLLGLETVIAGHDEVGARITKAHYAFENLSRDIVDETDEIFNVKFELTYTMGSQNALEFSPQRWKIVQGILGVVVKAIPVIQKSHPDGLEVILPVQESLPQDLQTQFRGFPRIRIMRKSAGTALLEEVSQRICEGGLEGYSSLAHQSPELQGAIRRYITQPELDATDLAKIKNRFNSESTYQPLLLLRGLIAGGILVFALQYKRWRVNYGLDQKRHPPTGLVVPYRAKDSPALRAEFSQPEVVVVLTCLSYYYRGLMDSELFRTFEHLLVSEQRQDEYDNWRSSSPSNLPPLDCVNIKDTEQCIKEIFQHLRYVKIVIDYYLSNIVFPKEMREFPKKLSASGWDLTGARMQPVTGFSGTNDLKCLLPLSIHHLDQPEQQHTNASVINCILRPENSVRMMVSDSQENQSMADFLLKAVAGSEPKIQVILDVGAQILDYANLDVAKKWLEIVPPCDAEAVIVFDDNDELIVVTRNGRTEPLRMSPYLKKVQSCLVFLDEAHTRGTDLRLPDYYRAAVMLGPNLAKDKLVQACMRMRKLGRGQSLVFFVPEEIRRSIAKLRKFSLDHAITKVDLLSWSIWQTWQESQRSIRLWTVQGTRHVRQQEAWSQVKAGKKFKMRYDIAVKHLENEAKSLEERYEELVISPQKMLGDNFWDQDQYSRNLNRIRDRCKEFGVFDLGSVVLYEEQERELAPEIEEEREIYKPLPLTAHKPSIHPDVEHFVCTGEIRPDSEAFIPAFLVFRDSSAARLIDLRKFPSDLLVTEEFARTVLPETSPFISDKYHRPVQWIVTRSSFRVYGNQGIENLVVFSPWEVNELLPQIHKHAEVTLHMYGARSSLSFRSMDDLTLYTTPSLGLGWSVPDRLRLLLNLFAGQLYFRSYKEYTEFCTFLGLAYQACVFDELEVGPDGDAQDISKTDVGRILAGEYLQADYFNRRSISSQEPIGNRIGISWRPDNECEKSYDIRIPRGVAEIFSEHLPEFPHFENDKLTQLLRNLAPGEGGVIEMSTGSNNSKVTQADHVDGSTFYGPKEQDRSTNVSVHSKLSILFLPEF
ncbi:hypothetical protein K432DRAFT_447027 [Lepidopterella palustris CBS 459.81]|uniref:ubiquitinyl hydrolase 1 n=1 Tax=Lepidopterella palustris CBS 459.81 TaxID=1314670 RepID=A0A8E2E023_9PEZI|nr:hypothetical protein K432DRAFT_447027 [Lepidopterella palustris CBS 459.81]